MSTKVFSSEEKGVLTQKIKHYFDQELNQEIGQFDAEFLLEFFGKEIGAYYYNIGLLDAQVVIDNHFESLKQSVYELEIPTASSK